MIVGLPAVALGVQCVWASLLTLPRTVTTDPATGAVRYGNVYTQLLEYIIPADLVFYGLLAGAVIVLRRKAPLAERPYRTIGYPVTPLVYISIAALLVADLAYLAPATAGMGCRLVMSGIPVYLPCRKRAVRRRVIDDVVDQTTGQSGEYGYGGPDTNRASRVRETAARRRRSPAEGHAGLGARVGVTSYGGRRSR